MSSVLRLTVEEAEAEDTSSTRYLYRIDSVLIVADSFDEAVAGWRSIQRRAMAEETGSALFDGYEPTSVAKEGWTYVLPRSSR